MNRLLCVEGYISNIFTLFKERCIDGYAEHL